ncbi:putative transcriptional regulator [Parageobacillus thermantarcticus]|jgi:putative transcriptional regulator|nr:helix-turn-helix domain-containing protein [Parageobacillus thermantarcticus]SFA55991.1 putative transcriptional regulator [Parageobacillus thermantarcticus]
MKCQLKLILDEIGMTQKQLAEKVNVSTPTISSIAKNQSIPRLDLAFRISKAVGRKIEEIWIYEEN